MKLFSRDEYGDFYVMQGEYSYLQTRQEWSQFLKPSRFNWLTFTFFHFDVDWHKIWYRHLTISAWLLGFGLVFYWGAPTDEQISGR
jgi:hypothetical protein